MMKRCTHCHEDKPDTAFRVYRHNGKLHSWCGACEAAYCKAWRAANPGYMTDYWRTHERPRKPQDAAKRAAYMKAYMRRRRQRHDAIDRGQSIDYAADKRRRFAAILAGVGK